VDIANKILNFCRIWNLVKYNRTKNSPLLSVSAFGFPCFSLKEGRNGGNNFRINLRLKCNLSNFLGLGPDLIQFCIQSETTNRFWHLTRFLRQGQYRKVRTCNSPAIPVFGGLTARPLGFKAVFTNVGPTPHRGAIWLLRGAIRKWTRSIMYMYYVYVT
jgi:hypothetical protein